jgi:hypothetical protein
LQQRSRMDFRWFVRHLEFSSESRNHYSDMQPFALSLRVDTLSIFFTTGRKSETMLQNAYFRKILFACVVVWIHLLLPWACIFLSPCVHIQSLASKFLTVAPNIWVLNMELASFHSWYA